MGPNPIFYTQHPICSLFDYDILEFVSCITCFLRIGLRVVQRDNSID
jgi:hypothetical protein